MHTRDVQRPSAVLVCIQLELLIVQRADVLFRRRWQVERHLKTHTRLSAGPAPLFKYDGLSRSSWLSNATQSCNLLWFALLPLNTRENRVNIQTLWTKLPLNYSMFDIETGVCHVGHSANSSGKANCFKLLPPLRPSAVGGSFLLSRLLVHAGKDTVVHGGAAETRRRFNFLQLNVRRFVFPLLPSFSLVIRRRETGGNSGFLTF